MEENGGFIFMRGDPIGRQAENVGQRRPAGHQDPIDMHAIEFVLPCGLNQNNLEIVFDELVTIEVVAVIDNNLRFGI